ncbi:MULTISPECIES: hypothetical protein [Pseudomonas fluorescens group]|uniref:Uncharacterized protein n=1 Tax=Pseudomonas fluorescens TaxID=294 RepID=A0A0D0TLW7_PSEFL|nr:MULTISPECIES: hypothetical protein [Pseudomonas fluorescens group]AZE61872.1 hypothetical protein C4K02_3513 [Pseudomonas synxantha]KIR24071.1 hypothetical protein PFLU3_03010 [Pseudomonas fluorescens]
MNSRYFPSNKNLPAPTIMPSHGVDSVKYPEVTDRKGKIVVPAYPGLAIGQKIYWFVRGNGTEGGPIVIENVESQYEAVLNFNRVFETESVVASYLVQDVDGTVISSSEEKKYFVLNRP